MTQTWSENPLKISVTSGGVAVDSLSVILLNPENAVATAALIANDAAGVNFIANLDLFKTLNIYMDYVDATTLQFSGTVEGANPYKSLGGQLVSAEARGKGRPLLLTHCNKTYGTESANPTLDTVSEIIGDIIDNYVEKSFAGSAIYTLPMTIAGTPAGSIVFFQPAYKNNFDLINQLCDIATAIQAGAAGPHFFVDVSGFFRMKQVGVTDANWALWWRTDLAGSTLTDGEDFADYTFHKNTTEFANRVLYCAGLRKPGYDFWTENQDGNWGKDANIDLLDTTPVKVGAASMRVNDNQGAGTSFLWWPSAKTAAWDITKIGSIDTIPSLNFYARRTAAMDGLTVSVYTSAGNFVTANLINELANVDEWYHFSLPLGPYFNRPRETASVGWTETGTIDWANINWIQFYYATSLTARYLYLDDLHIAGKIIREAVNNTNITANGEVQAVIPDDTAYDDSMKQADDTGTVARLAYAELLRRQTLPLLGTVTTPFIQDIFPGQQIHVHADKQNGTFRVDSTFRVLEARHDYNLQKHSTQLQVSSDLLNSHSKPVPSTASLISQYTFFGNKEAKNLKNAQIDLLIPRLSVAYNS